MRVLVTYSSIVALVDGAALSVGVHQGEQTFVFTKVDDFPRAVKACLEKEDINYDYCYESALRLVPRNLMPIPVFQVLETAKECVNGKGFDTSQGIAEQSYPSAEVAKADYLECFVQIT
jgi:hypothetical protein